MIILLALAKVARVRELNTLDITRKRFEHATHRAVHLGLCWNFIAKNQLNQSFSITPLTSSIVGTEDDKELLLCPLHVRLLQDSVCMVLGNACLFPPFRPPRLKPQHRIIIVACHHPSGL